MDEIEKFMRAHDDGKQEWYLWYSPARQQELGNQVYYGQVDSGVMVRYNYSSSDMIPPVQDAEFLGRGVFLSLTLGEEIDLTELWHSQWTNSEVDRLISDIMDNTFFGSSDEETPTE